MAVACHTQRQPRVAGRDASWWDRAPGSGRSTLQLHGKIVFFSEVIRSEARVVVSVGEIKGVPDPSASHQLEAGSEAPVITYSYCVTYEFAEGEEVEDGSSSEVCA